MKTADSERTKGQGKQADDERAAPDVRALMADIRARVRQDIDAHRDRLPAFTPTAPGDSGATRRAGELLFNAARDLSWLPMTARTPSRARRFDSTLAISAWKWFPLVT